MWNLGNVSGCGSTSLSLVLMQGLTKVSDQSRALEDRNDSNNSLEVYTPNSFIHLSYNSPYMDVVDMYNIIIIPSDSVLWKKTMEASYLVGSFPCQFNFISVFNIPVWDGVWEQATFRHFCPFWQAAHSIYPLSPHQVMVGTLESRFRICPLSPHQVMVGTLESRFRMCPLSPHQVMVGTLESRFRMCPLSPHQVMVGTLESRFCMCPLSPHQVMVGTLESRIRRIHLYLSQQIGVRSSKTSQCSSANRPSVVPQGSPRVLVPF